MAFDATIGGASANSYSSVADADAYFADRTNAAEWTAVTDKEKALVSATDYLEMFSYRGFRSTEAQALSHPRAQMLNREKIGYIGSGVIAGDVLKAVHELALYLNNNAELFVTDDNITDIKVGPISIKQKIKVFGEYSSLPLNVQRLIKPYLGTGGAAGFDLSRA